MSLTTARLEAAYQTVRAALLTERQAAGYWVGELSTSALSTAVASSALALVDRAGQGEYRTLVEGGMRWLAEHQNADGGWGDTVRSFSNISTTMLCRAAFHLTGTAAQHASSLTRCEQWLQRFGKTPAELAEAIRQRYGSDRTFSVPILMTSALAGLVEWQEVPPLPFELACFPQSMYRFAGLPVVSYALPALIAIGQAVFHHRTPWNPIVRGVRNLAMAPSLRVLESIQPPNGGFLEAAPLTSFVALGLASTGRADHPVVRLCVKFLVASVRPDGSWPIDTNLSTWVTTLAINALASAGDLESLPGQAELRDWLLAQQYHKRHPFTGAEPGAWAWTPLPGGVPDADDTPGALLALRALLGNGAEQAVERFARRAVGPVDIGKVADGWSSTVRVQGESKDPGVAALLGMRWLLRLQNRDGGWPTFCRGWGKLPFDRSGTDLTAHALRALHVWRPTSVSTRVAGQVEEALNLRVLVDGMRVSFPTSAMLDAAQERGLAYLARFQRTDGSWLPLWFGNQHAPDDINPTYGTGRVLLAYRDLGLMQTEPARRGIAWLIDNQNADGGWGGMRATPSSVEETALALEALLGESEQVAAVTRGLSWLVDRVEAGTWREETPIGFYFAKLWYFERMYPLVYAAAALGRGRRVLAGR